MKKTRTKTPEFDPDPALLRKARLLARHYTVVIEPDEEGGFIGHARELPGVIGSGTTVEACVRDLSFALETTVATYLVERRPPPAPISRERRSEQVNLRLTPSEKDVLTQESTRRGFRGVADYIRAQVIGAINGTSATKVVR